MVSEITITIPDIMFKDIYDITIWIKILPTYSSYHFDCIFVAIRHLSCLFYSEIAGQFLFQVVLIHVPASLLTITWESDCEVYYNHMQTT